MRKGLIDYGRGDATDEKTAEKTVKLAIETFGRIDMFLSNAGIGIYKPFWNRPLSIRNLRSETGGRMLRWKRRRKRLSPQMILRKL